MFENSVLRKNVDTREWMKRAAIRAVKTAAQTLVALIPAATTISDVDWKVALGTAALAAVTSLLTSVAGIPETTGEYVQEDEE